MPWVVFVASWSLLSKSKISRQSADWVGTVDCSQQRVVGFEGMLAGNGLGIALTKKPRKMRAFLKCQGVGRMKTGSLNGLAKSP